jgi:hypothetical protein
MLAAETDLQIARRQARQAQARVKRQQALVDALSRQGVDPVRARRQLEELRLVADLLQDRVANLEPAVLAGAPLMVGGNQMASRARQRAAGHA